MMVWLSFMLFVLAIWAGWMNQVEELLHPRSEERALVSLLVVLGVAVVSAAACLLLQGLGA